MREKRSSFDFECASKCKGYGLFQILLWSVGLFAVMNKTCLKLVIHTVMSLLDIVD